MVQVPALPKVPWLFSRISHKFVLAFGILIALGAINVLISQNFIKDLNGRAETINVAGRLRMLSQKLAFESVKVLRDSVSDKQAATDTIDTFEHTLRVLSEGGQAFGYHVPASTPDVAIMVQGIRETWPSYRRHAEEAIRFKGKKRDGDQLIANINKDAASLLERSDKLVTALTRQTQKLHERQLAISYALLVIDSLILIGMYAYTRRRIIEPMRRLATHSNELAQGNFRSRTRVNSHDELGQLADAFNVSAGMLGDMINRMLEDRQSIAHTEAMFRGLAENSVVGVYIIEDERFMFVNPRMAEMFGYSRHDMIERVRLTDIVDEEDLEFVHVNRVRRISGEVDKVRYERRAVHSDGSRFFVEVFGSVMQVSGEPVTIGVMHDITERKRAEQTAALLSACNQALVRAKSEESLLADICRQMRGHGDYPFVWVGFASGDQDFPVRLVACDEEEQGVLQVTFGQIRQSVAHLRHGPAATAMRTGLHVTVQEFDSDVYGEAWCIFASRFGIASAISIPLCADGEILGTLTVYSRRPEALNAREVPLIQELAGNLAYGIQALRARKSHELYARQLEFNATHDALTGLANRNLLGDRMKQSFRFANRYGHAVALLLLDLDNFKVINDSLGHAAGDVLLQGVSRRLREAVRDSDTVARFGGDEFIIVMPMTSGAADAEAVARKILSIMDEPFQLGGQPAHVRCSVGISLYPRDGVTEERLLKNVDLAMYKAKADGRNTYCFYQKAFDVANKERQVLEARLHEALKNHEFVLHYQPKVGGNGAFVGVEALVRWRHPVDGMISPEKFIPVAEESSLIVQLGKWVLKEACRQAKEWEGITGRKIGVAVNLSARQIQLDDIVTSVGHVIVETGIAPDMLHLEITETALIQDPSHATTILSRLSALGVHLSLDDFGVGYSSLNHLRTFPLDTIKIDKSFIADVMVEEQDATIVKSVIRLAHNLGLTVVAEGVETREQADFLKAEGCDVMQGYYFSKPLAVPDIGDYLASHLSSVES
jgi:diguanylate cyclase (GGDEF)-like protein/PAS domain S-box-containing protein